MGQAQTGRDTQEGNVEGQWEYGADGDVILIEWKQEEKGITTTLGQYLTH